MDDGALERAIRALRAEIAADRCSVTLFDAITGGSDLYAVDDDGYARRALPIQPHQLAEHFADGHGAERHTVLQGSAFLSDRSLAAKGYREVIRAAVRDRDGRVVGILNAMWMTERDHDEADVRALDRVAGELGAAIAVDREGPR